MAKPFPAVILAAGESKRLGRPKAFVKVAGRTLLEHAIERFQVLNCEPIVIVTNQECFFQATIQSKGVIVALNNKPQEGRTGSIQIGISAIINEIGRMPKQLILAPVDRPGWMADSASKLLGSKVSSCLYSNGRKGHPVSIVGNDLHNLVNADKMKSLRDIITFENVNVNEPFLSLNIDTEEDVKNLKLNEDFFQTI